MTNSSAASRKGRKVPFILQWNCASLQPRLHELNLHLRSSPIPLLALSEAGLPNMRSISGYTAYRNATISTFPNGSAILYVRNNYNHSEVDVRDLCSDELDMAAVRVQIQDKIICVASIYMRPRVKVNVQQIIANLVKRCSGRLIICGDWNAHHSLWGDTRNDRRGQDLAHTFEKNNLVVANDGSPTFYRPPSSLSAIDITVHSLDLNITWEISADTMGSDHFPIYVSIEGYRPKYQRSFSVTHWDRFRSTLNIHKGDIITAIKESKTAATVNIQLPDNYPSPDLTLLNLCAERRRAQRRFRRTGNPEIKTHLNRINAKIRRYTTRLRRCHWADMCASLNAHSPIPRIWRVLDSLSGQRRTRKPFSCMSLVTGENMETLSERFAVHFAYAKFKSKMNIVLNTTSSPLDAPFTLKELLSALRKCRRRSAPGPDGITTQMLKNLPPPFTARLLEYFNEIWKRGLIPDTWKTSWVVPILKSGKAPTEPSSYRPVSLTSCVAKVMERMVHGRLTWWLETKRPLPHCMTGFRPRLCTADSILDFVSAAEHSRNIGHHTIVVFFDVAKAFDNVDVAAVVRQLTGMGITGQVQTFIWNFLHNRSLQVRLGSTLSEPRQSHRGLPQGCVLSPLLFNLVMAGLPSALTKLPKQVDISLYADDICLWVSGHKCSNLKTIMQAAISSTQEYLATVGLAISAEKTAFMVIPGLRRRAGPVILSLGDIRLRRVRRYKFLGVIIDSTLNWKSAVDLMVRSSTAARNVVRRVAGMGWGNAPRSMLALHSSLVLSRMLYMLPYVSPSMTQYERLEVIHRQGLRTTIGVHQATNCEKLYRETEASTVRLLATERLLHHIIRLSTTRAGMYFLRRLSRRTKSHFHACFNTLSVLGWSPPTSQSKPQKVWTPWDVDFPDITETIPRMSAKHLISAPEGKCLVEDHLTSTYPGYLRVYTDGSVRYRMSSTAAYVIPDLNCMWKARLDRAVSSTVAEAIAIREALDALLYVQPQPTVILTDSRATLSRLQNSDDEITHTALTTLRRLQTLGFKINFQWIPSHIGISGNEAADRLAAEAHCEIPSLVSPTDPREHILAVREHIASLSCAGKNVGFQPCVTKGLTRLEATTLYRLRTDSAWTPAFRYKINNISSPNCQLCNVRSDQEHILWECPLYDVPRQELSKNLERLGLPLQDSNEVIFPTGTRRKQMAVQRMLLQYLREANLMGTL